MATESAIESNWERLLSPGQIGSLELRNRIVMTPMGSNLAEADGQVGERIQRYYEERARGGAGLLIVGVGAIAHPVGTCNPNQVGVSHDRYLPGLTRLVERIHAEGARVALQLQHAGKVATRDIITGRPLWVPSAMRHEAGDLMNDLSAEEVEAVTGAFRQPGAKLSYRPMTLDDIRQLVRWFADAAERTQRAGFDGAELHAGHGYLLSAFLSPKTNQRTDEYGGSLENRSRLLVEVIEAVRERVGRDFPLWCRLDAKEFRTEGGIAVEDARRTAELAEAAGLDAVHVSAYADPSSAIAFTDAPLVHEPCGFLELAAGIRQRVKIPVIAVGRIGPQEAERAISAGKIDFVAMGRKLLADPELPNKLAAGRPEDIRPCIYCYTCVGQVFLNRPLCCAVNPATGREAEFELSPTRNPRHVLVVGGGPGGMEVARIAALRGHRVTLCESASRLGGTARCASRTYPVNAELTEWLALQLRKLPVEIRLGQEVTPAYAKALAPDVIVVATGARRAPPEIPGVEQEFVLGGDELHSLLVQDDAADLPGKLASGQRVAVIGGGLVGVELAEFLCRRGCDVCLFESGATLGAQLAPPRRWRVLHALRAHGASLFSQSRVSAIGEHSVVYQDAQGASRESAFDRVILALGECENSGLASALGKEGTPVHQVGDCQGVGYIAGAMLDAARVAHAL